MTDRERITLANGRELTCEVLEVEDITELAGFLCSLPDVVRFFLPLAVNDAQQMKQFELALASGSYQAVLARCGDEVVGVGLLKRPRYGWSGKVGEILVAIAPPFQQQNLGRQLVLHLFDQARSAGLRQLYCFVLAKHTGLVESFERAGFHKAALLRDFARDDLGRAADLCMLTRSVDDLWHKIEDSINFTGRAMEH
ncbi:GNAT family N-acetyltransferase [bacterium]|nr:GNAT family N-acetyltransferase [candidate division CSSED10-310 bacterium]